MKQVGKALCATVGVAAVLGLSACANTPLLKVEVHQAPPPAVVSNTPGQPIGGGNVVLDQWRPSGPVQTYQGASGAVTQDGFTVFHFQQPGSGLPFDAAIKNGKIYACPLGAQMTSVEKHPDRTVTINDNKTVCQEFTVGGRGGPLTPSVFNLVQVPTSALPYDSRGLQDPFAAVAQRGAQFYGDPRNNNGYREQYAPRPSVVTFRDGTTCPSAWDIPTVVNNGFGKTREEACLSVRPEGATVVGRVAQPAYRR